MCGTERRENIENVQNSCGTERDGKNKIKEKEGEVKKVRREVETKKKYISFFFLSSYIK